MSTGILIYFAFLIPLIGVIVCSTVFAHKVTLWERALIFFIPVLIVFLVKTISVHTQKTSTEYLNSYLVKAQYYEYWETYKQRTCTRCTSRDKDGNCNHTQYYDCSHCDHNQPYWTALDNMGRSYSLDRDFFENICTKWDKRVLVDLHRGIRTHWDCGKDGNMYETTFDGKLDRIIPVCRSHSYENKIKCSKALFNFQKVDSSDKAKFNLFDYPPMSEFNYNPVLGDQNPGASLRLSQYNAKLGVEKQVHMLILVFDNQPLKAAYLQEAYWKRGNKNEVILCIGRTDSTVLWAKVISWTDVEELKISVAQKVSKMRYDLPAIVDTLALEVQKQFVRKQFKDFSYLTVEPTMGALIWAFVLSFLSTAVICFFSVLNGFNFDSTTFIKTQRKF